MSAISGRPEVLGDSSGMHPAYGSQELHSLDTEDRLQDDTSDGIDWDEIIATTEEDFLAGRFSFNSEGYPTEEAAMAAMKALMDSILKEVMDEHAARNSLDATRCA